MRSFPAEFKALEYFKRTSNCDALTDGGIVIYASGNEAAAFSSYPGGYRDNISVCAFNPDFLPSTYTNYGAGCNISAPGGEMGGLSGGAEPAYFRPCAARWKDMVTTVICRVHPWRVLMYQAWRLSVCHTR